MSALPRSSDVDLLCYCERIVGFNSQVPDGTFDFGLPQVQPTLRAALGTVSSPPP